ncbi:MAG: tRNA (adenosine(37)-N6)-threonylcarbamoyltransferase complex dimerization subunit type 1 TsaB [Treponema sp.]|mgnify:CR=1 FL=1|nr:tRNA (adenosine(37)-N6)-threonylcarbamoyltransferase complex dimerization subunit type 1 TsaB [Treponema sp.]
MNILVLDCAVTKLSIAVKTEDKFISQTYDIGMRQSEILVPTIDEILSKAGITAADLNYSALTIGPGSFTGLRLGISALKAIELAYNVPVYGISSLTIYSYAYKDLGLPILACIDANKDKFYACLSDQNSLILEEGDYEVEEIISKLNGLSKVLLAGPDAQKLADIIKENKNDIEVLTTRASAMTTEALVAITEDKISKGEATLKDFDGPVYLRASEAELALKSKN